MRENNFNILAGWPPAFGSPPTGPQLVLNSGGTPKCIDASLIRWADLQEVKYMAPVFRFVLSLPGSPREPRERIRFELTDT